MVVHRCKSKINKKNLKINQQKKFFFKKNKQTTTTTKHGVQKHAKKRSTVAKMTTSIQFPSKDILTPHRYKRTLKAHLTKVRRSPVITEAWRFSLRIILGPLL